MKETRAYQRVGGIRRVREGLGKTFFVLGSQFLVRGVAALHQLDGAEAATYIPLTTHVTGHEIKLGTLTHFNHEWPHIKDKPRHDLYRPQVSWLVIILFYLEFI